MTIGRIVKRKRGRNTAWDTLIIILASIFSSFAYSQNGKSFISNYSFSPKIGQLKVLDITQDAEGLLLLAPTKVLAKFDRVNWE